ncbi:MAG: hypothetical protein JWQ43_844 [Glaciihabitans sp.]|nr:hypothetical protein [Glaciihabitans sp.]
MGSSHSTTLVLVGDGASNALGALDHFANVSTARFSDTRLGGATDNDVQRWITRAHSPYVVHDRDPLGHVASAWVEFFDDVATLGTLDLEIDRALAAFERGDLSMPDYYVVVEPENLSTTWQHWWLGILSQAAPTRVIPWDDTSTSSSTSLGRMLRTLPSSRPWPQPEPWLHSVARTIPGQLTTNGGAQGSLAGDTD